MRSSVSPTRLLSLTAALSLGALLGALWLLGKASLDS